MLKSKTLSEWTEMYIFILIFIALSPVNSSAIEECKFPSYELYHFLSDDEKKVHENQNIKVTNFDISKLGIKIPDYLFELDTYGLYPDINFANQGIRSFLDKQKYPLQILTILGACGNSDAAYSLYNLFKFGEEEKLKTNIKERTKLKNFWLRRAVELGNTKAAFLYYHSMSSPYVIKTFLNVYQDIDNSSALRGKALSALTAISKLGTDINSKILNNLKFDINSVKYNDKFTYFSLDYMSKFGFILDYTMTDMYKTRSKNVLKFYHKKSLFNPEVARYLAIYYSVRDHKKALEAIEKIKDSQFRLNNILFGMDTAYLSPKACLIRDIVSQIKDAEYKIKYISPDDEIKELKKQLPDLPVPQEIDKKFIDADHNKLYRLLFKNESYSLNINEKILSIVPDDLIDEIRHKYLELNFVYKAICSFVLNEILNNNENAYSFRYKDNEKEYFNTKESAEFLFEELVELFYNIQSGNISYIYCYNYLNGLIEDNFSLDCIDNSFVYSKKLKDKVNIIDNYLKAISMDDLLEERDRIATDIKYFEDMIIFKKNSTEEKLYWLNKALQYQKSSTTCSDDILYELAILANPVYDSTNTNYNLAFKYLTKSHDLKSNIARYVSNFALNKKTLYNIFIKGFEVLADQDSEYKNKENYFFYTQEVVDQIKSKGMDSPYSSIEFENILLKKCITYSGAQSSKDSEINRIKSLLKSKRQQINTIYNNISPLKDTALNDYEMSLISDALSGDYKKSGMYKVSFLKKGWITPYGYGFVSEDGDFRRDAIPVIYKVKFTELEELFDSIKFNEIMLMLTWLNQAFSALSKSN